MAEDINTPAPPESERYSREGVMAQVEKRLDKIPTQDALSLLRSAELQRIELNQEQRLGLLRHASVLLDDQLKGLLNINNQRGHLDLQPVIEGIACIRLAQITKEKGANDSIHLVDTSDTANMLRRAIEAESPAVAIISDRLSQTTRVTDRFVQP